ncbi:MAG: PspC domain-containing protein [Dehalococcoidia bacterium]|nr:PspC domain-containing protein [Dehalococcoidia bacterium]
MTPKRVRKSSLDKMLFGVAGGLAEYFNIDPVLVRLAFVLSIFAGGVGIIAYIVLAIIMPQGESTAAHPADVVKENLHTIGQEAAEAAHRVEDAVRGTPPKGEGMGTPETPTEQPDQTEQTRRRTGLGIILVALGVVFLLANLGALRWFRWGAFWPVVLILAGLAIIIGRFRRM